VTIVSNNERPPFVGALGRRRIHAANNARGGLRPTALRRVSEYIEAHLDEHIDLNTLAGAAGLSLYHFARAFKQSKGTTPHLFLLERRLIKAQQLLAERRLSLSEIALCVGFFDQSHFVRRFRELVGMPPGQFRRSTVSESDCRKNVPKQEVPRATRIPSRS
jgi:AraC-like DNA-binding protein